ncbi:MAG: hypothetical protein JRJ00_08745, partial [Deltaproteobacteria bacterium]|nr:hypothetical protein [Deltaproteobacteria bacterium]
MKSRIVCAVFGILKEFIKKAAIPVLVFSFIVFCAVIPQHAMAQPRPLTQTLSFKGKEKVAQPEFLEKFNQGAEKVKILVLLKDYENYKGLSVAEDVVLMKEVQSDIKDRQGDVLKAFDPKKFQLKHRFDNILGFSGEATLQAIKDLASMDEVKFIE